MDFLGTKTRRFFNVPTITLNKKTVFRLLGRSISDDELKEKVPMLGTPIEDLGKEEFTIEVAPNRPDLLSEQGFSRAFSSFLGFKTGLRKYNVLSSGEKVIIEPSVKKVRPFTACAIVKNLSFNDEKIKEVVQIQEKLHVTYGRNRKKVAIGIYPMEHIKPPIRFKALVPNEIRFQPLESNREMTGLQILSQHHAGREYGHLLEGAEVFPIFIDANDNILSMPPIINSHDTGKISEKTTEVFIECSGFDFNVLQICLNMIVTALADMGGRIYSMQLIDGKKKHITPDLNPEKMDIDTGYVNRLLGLELNDNEIKRYLERMGFGYSNKKVLVPAYRADIMHSADFAEDIAIGYGFDNFEPIIPNVSTIAQEDRFEIFKRRLSNLLVGLGLIETKTYNLTSMHVQKNRMKLAKLELVELVNALTVDYNVLRYWVIPSLLETLKYNKNNEYPQNIFTIGTIFKNKDNDVVENDRLCVLLCDKDVDFTKIKQVLDVISGALEIKYEINETEHPSFIEGRIGRVSVNKKDVAYIGEIHPEVLENFELEMPVVALELNLTELYEVLE